MQSVPNARAVTANIPSLSHIVSDAVSEHFAEESTTPAATLLVTNIARTERLTRCFLCAASPISVVYGESCEDLPTTHLGEEHTQDIAIVKEVSKVACPQRG